MNEFYRPDRQDTPVDDAPTIFDEPADEINIVVNENDNGSQRFCVKCGKPLEQQDSFCGNCGAPVNGTQVNNDPHRHARARAAARAASARQAAMDAQARAGAVMRNEPIPGQTINNYQYNYYTNDPRNGGFNGSSKVKNKWCSLLLCFFFGMFGVHRFYEGKIGTGILWACTFGFLGIGWLIDLIILLFKPHWYEP